MTEDEIALLKLMVEAIAEAAVASRPQGATAITKMVEARRLLARMEPTPRSFKVRPGA